MFIDGVKVIAYPVLSTEDIQYFVAEEKRLWQSKNKQLGQLELGLDGEEVILKLPPRTSLSQGQAVGLRVDAFSESTLC